MNQLLKQANETPVTLLVALAYVTLAFLTDPFSPSVEQLRDHGWLTPVLAANGEPWRLLTHAFLHGGVIHLFLNLYVLLIVGPPLERSIGSTKLGALYVVAALGGAIAVCVACAPGQAVVGGSGAIFGMLGGLVAKNMRAGRHVFSFLDFHGPRQLLLLIFVNLAIGFLIPVVSNEAHIGGLLAGWAFTFLFLDTGRSPGRLRPFQLACAAVFLSLLVHVLAPVTRYDWLLVRAVRTEDPAAKAELLRAAAIDWTGRPTLTAADGAALLEGLRMQGLFDGILPPQKGSANGANGTPR